MTFVIFVIFCLQTLIIILYIINLKNFCMKKINFFLSVAVTVLSLVLFSACGSAEGDSKPLPTMVLANGANSAFVLPEATLVSIQNTKRGCEILMMTELGRQVFVLPYHYDISAYDGLKVSTTEGKKKIEPFDVFGKEREFFSDGEVKLYPDKAVAFEMPDGSAFVLIALDGVDLQKLQYLRFTMQKGKLFTRLLPIDAVHFVEASSSYANQTIIPLYHLESDKCYSEPTAIRQLLDTHSVKGLYVVFN